ncbi:MAG: polymerase sigma-70 factor, subfamily [Blastococcus sp.]|nr:polymerase sigma-70 factor, subfamily [Blastococcus sp.]
MGFLATAVAGNTCPCAVRCPFVRLKRAASVHPTDAGEVTAGPVCDPGGVSEPVNRTDPAGAAVPAAAVPLATVPLATGPLEVVPLEVAPQDAPVAEAWVAPTWDQVVREHSARVYRLAYRLSGNPQDAEDLTQETFVRVFRSLATFAPGTFEGWLHRITTNLFLDMVRRRQRIRFDALPEDTERLPGAAPSPEQVYADTHLDPQIQAALDALSPEFRVAVVLCDIEGLTYEEISATLGIKLGTVRSRIHRGRVQLRQALAHLAPGRVVVPDPLVVEGQV